MKKMFLLCMLALSYMTAHAQATDLVIDNQTPGWLSSKINYGDQQTVENLKITGYINTTDLKFIGQLIRNRSLHGRIDLFDAHIVKENVEASSNWEDNYLGSIDGGNCFGLGAYPRDSIRSFVFPKSLKKAGSPLNNLHVDSVYINCDIHYANNGFIGGSSQTEVEYLIFGENIDSIPDKAFDYSYFDKKCNVIFSPAVRYIGHSAFWTFKSVNINDLKNLQFLGREAFERSKVETLQIPPKLTRFYTSSIGYNDGAHIFVHELVDTIDNEVYQVVTSASGTYSRTLSFIKNTKKIVFHLRRSIPPVLLGGDYNCLTNSILYVPRGASESYKNANYWKYATIIEENPLQRIDLNNHEICMDINETIPLLALPVPSDADDISIIWKSGNESIVSVNDQGIITGISSGEAMVYAISKANPEILDSCQVMVIKHVESINLSFNQIELNGLGQTKQITPIVLPEDATDKSVRWSSSNESVCFVTDNGTAIAMGEGTAVVLALTNDGNLPATCVVSVSLKKEATGINDVRPDCDDGTLIFSHDGKLLGNGVSTLRHLKSGVYIIKKGNEFVKVKL